MDPIELEIDLNDLDDLFASICKYFGDRHPLVANFANKLGRCIALL